MKIVIAGGAGYLGKLLSSHFLKDPDNEVFILSRSEKLNKKNLYYLKWNGKTESYWTQFLEHTDVLINLVGKSVDCRYSKTNKAEIYASRLESSSILCKMVSKLTYPPKVFIQSSSATIYKHSENKLMTEKDGEIGVDFSMDVCKKWEAVFTAFHLPQTKKIIARTSIVMGKSGGAFPIIKRLTQLGLGGRQGDGNQFISWITEEDYIRAIEHLIYQNSGIYNLCVPNPIKNMDFQKKLREKLKVKVGLPTPKLLLGIGAFLMQTEPELVLKSRKVYPEKLLETGFKFKTQNFNEYIV